MIWDEFGSEWCLYGAIVMERHGPACAPGLWRVAIFGWGGVGYAAVVDDFGSLVTVRP